MNRASLWRTPQIGCTAAATVGAVLLLALSYGFGSPIHYSADIRARVIDEHTGKPLDRVAVCAAWWVGGLSGSTVHILYKTCAITNRAGEFTLRGMPPRLRAPLTWFRSYDPMIFVYKPGYVTATRSSADLAPLGYRGPFNFRTAKRRSPWNGQTIALNPAPSVEAQARALSTIESELLSHRLRPDQYPEVWQILVEGYDRLPVDHSGDPRKIIDYWSKGRR